MPQKLTFGIWFTRGGDTFHFSFNVSEEIFAVLDTSRVPELLVDHLGAKSLGRCIFKPSLSVPNAGLHKDCCTQMVWVTERMRLGLFGVNLSIFEPVFIEKKRGQGSMNYKQGRAPVESGCNFERERFDIVLVSSSSS